jgi:hypothetical protein
MQSEFQVQALMTHKKDGYRVEAAVAIAGGVQDLERRLVTILQRCVPVRAQVLHVPGIHGVSAVISELVDLSCRHFLPVFSRILPSLAADVDHPSVQLVSAACRVVTYTSSRAESASYLVEPFYFSSLEYGGRCGTSTCMLATACASFATRLVGVRFFPSGWWFSEVFPSIGSGGFVLV